MKENRQDNRNQWQNAYLSATYELDESGIQIKINDKNQKLDALLYAASAKKWAFITAENPRSEVLTDQENAQRTLKLKVKLEDKGYSFLHGSSKDPTGEWPTENSFLILDIEKGEALKLAKAFDQHAILFGKIYDQAKLVWAD